MNKMMNSWRWHISIVTIFYNTTLCCHKMSPYPLRITALLFRRRRMVASSDLLAVCIYQFNVLVLSTVNLVSGLKTRSMRWKVMEFVTWSIHSNAQFKLQINRSSHAISATSEALGRWFDACWCNLIPLCAHVTIATVFVKVFNNKISFYVIYTDRCRTVDKMWEDSCESSTRARCLFHAYTSSETWQNLDQTNMYRIILM